MSNKMVFLRGNVTAPTFRKAPAQDNKATNAAAVRKSTRSPTQTRSRLVAIWRVPSFERQRAPAAC